MLIELTIKSTYLPSWGSWEGIRELVQNGRDAELEHGAALKVSYQPKGQLGQLRIENEGCTLPIKALLLGHTSKAGNSDLAGQWGEGLKLGILALVRAGYRVKIRNGSDVWTPQLVDSVSFGEPVLAFRIEGGREFKNRVRVEVEGLSATEWQDLKGRFLFLNRKVAGIKVYKGTLLTAPEQAGKVYCKGILVQQVDGLQYGYDLNHAELDRDRKMVESWNLKWLTSEIVQQASLQDPTITESLAEMLGKSARDVEGITDSYQVDTEVAKRVTAIWQARYPTATPVADMAESQAMEHLGRQGVVVPRQLGVVLARTLGSVQQVREQLAREASQVWSWHELAATEQANLTRAVEMLATIEPIELKDIQICDFRSANLEGQYEAGQVRVARKCLQDLPVLLGVLIHEVSHRRGSDGDKQHVQQIESIWQAVVGNLLKTPN